MLRLPLPPPPPAAHLPAPPCPSPPTSSATAAPVDLYRKRKLAQLAQQHQTPHPHLAATADKPPTTADLTPLSPPRKKANANPVSSPGHRLAQRQKQLEMGYATAAYALYVRCVSLAQREEARREDGHPVTPRKEQKCSKRSWDGQVRKWRRQLHDWDEGGRMHATHVGGSGSGGAGGGCSGGAACEARAESAVEGAGADSTLDAASYAKRGLDVDDEAVGEEGDDEDEDEDDWRESIVRMAGALPD